MGLIGVAGRYIDNFELKRVESDLIRLRYDAKTFWGAG